MRRWRAGDAQGRGHALVGGCRANPETLNPEILSLLDRQGPLQPLVCMRDPPLLRTAGPLDMVPHDSRLAVPHQPHCTVPH